MGLTLVRNIEDYNIEQMEKKLIKICSPLFTSSDITYFQYDKSFHDRSRITLSTKASWIYHYYDSGYYKQGMHHKDIRTYKSGFNLWNCTGRACVINLAKEEFEIDNGFTIMDRSPNACEFYHFASCPGNNQVINFYFNYLNLLRRFIAYFKCEARQLIETSLKDKIRYSIFDNPNTQEKSSLQSIDTLDKNITVSRFYFNSEDSEYYLTEQELYIAKWLIQGKTAKEIGAILAISSRTVETHISNIKNKLQCYKQTKIVQKLLSIGVGEILSV